MHARTRSHAGVATMGIAAVGIAAMAATPLAPATQAHSRPAVSSDVRLTAAEVPPGGLITSFLGNQVIYCSLVCPGLVQTGVTPVVTTLQAPGVFVTALQSGDLLKAIGATAASVTGPTNAAAAADIVADGTLVAPRALNAFETLVVGLLNVVPAATGGLPGIATAIQAARQDTFTAQNLPIVANPAPTVMPQGVVEVAAVGALNVGGAIIFNGFNDILFGAFATPNAVAQELAATGDPVRAAAAGVTAAAGAVTAAGTVVAESVVTAVNNVRAGAGQSHPGNAMTQIQNSSIATTSVPIEVAASHRLITTPKHAATGPVSPHPLRDVTAKVRQAVRSVVNKVAERPGSTVSSKPTK